MITEITVDYLKGRNACYWEEDGYFKIAARYEAALPASPLEVAKAEWVPAKDRLWVLLHVDFIQAREMDLLACDFAKDVLPHWEAAYPDDDRPRRAIETKRRWLNGEATDAELAGARAAAWAAARDAEAAAIAAVDAAWAAARDVDWAAEAAVDAAWAAEDAARAAEDAARAATARQLAMVIEVLERQDEPACATAKSGV